MSDCEERRATREEAVRNGPEEAAEPASAEAPWLLRHKVGLPDLIEGYVERPELERRCALLDRRLTVLHAPGGFGKTALLARCCRALRERGVAVAWLSLDEEDGPGSVATHLAHAFEEAGLPTFAAAGRTEPDDAGAASDPQAESQAEYRIELLLRALARGGAPCVVALDEVERLRSPEAAAAINALVHRGPDNLHVAMAFREQPAGLQLAMLALEGREETVAEGDLRFSRSDIARFFDEGLSRRELNSVAAESAGWPLALRIHRNARRRGEPGGADRTVADWIETRLWRGMSAADREFVLDLALFDGLGPELIDEVTGEGNSERRIAGLGALAGLVSTAGGKPAMRLHPLVREHCGKCRYREDPDRYRAVNRGIAQALERRGRAVEGLRHAAEAGDVDLLGRMAEDTGGVRLWLEQGLEALRTVDRLLPAEVLAKYPRTALVRCAALTCAGEIAQAKRVHADAAATTGGFARDREGGDDRALRAENVFVQGLLYMCGCVPYDDGVFAAVTDAGAAADTADTDPLLRGVFSLGMCIVRHQTTAFDEAAEWAGRARAVLGRRSPYLAHVDFQAGSMAMALGRTDEARDCYERALAVARASHLRDAGAVVVGQVLAAELALERSAGVPRRHGPAVSPRLLGECSAWLDVYAAGIAGAAERALVRDGPQAALALAEDAGEYARRTERPALARFVAALRTALLAADGDVEGAARAWRFERLPEDAAACTDLTTQSWREAEMVACARLGLLIEQGAFVPARELASMLLMVAAERGLLRTRMRGLALSAVLEHRAGDDRRARAQVAEYLRLYGDADYARPLARVSEVALPLLDGIADDGESEAAVRETAARLRDAVRDQAASQNPPPEELNEREMEVLVLLERHKDREIAAALSLSHDGVRSRLRTIFAKLGARGRLDAVHRARERGILPRADEAAGADA